MAAAIDDRGDHVGRWADLDGLLLRDGNLKGPGFEPGEDVKSVLHDMVHVLVIGAGGLGCELLKDLGACGRACGRAGVPTHPVSCRFASWVHSRALRSIYRVCRVAVREGQRTVSCFQRFLWRRWT